MTDTTAPAVAETQLQNIMMTTIEKIGFGDGALHAPDQSPDELRTLGETIATRYMKKVEKGACGVCMDGRGCTHTIANTLPGLGPKCAGGPLQTGFAAAEIVEGYYGSQSGETAPERALEVGELLNAQGITIGGHTTEKAVTNNFVNPETGQVQTGCGAGEKHNSSCMRILGRDKNVVQTADSLLGAPYTLKTVSLETMAQRNQSYNPKMMFDIESAQNDHKNAEILEGDHKELAIVWNKVRGYTVDRDAFLKETGKEVFVIDEWYLEDIARAMASGRPDATEIYPALLRACTEYQLATYAELGDGSHPVIVLDQAA